MSDDGSVAIRTGDDDAEVAEVSEVDQKLAEYINAVKEAERVLALAQTDVIEAEEAVDAAPPGPNVGQQGPARVKLAVAKSRVKAASTSLWAYKKKLEAFVKRHGTEVVRARWVQVVDEQGREKWMWTGDELGGNPFSEISKDIDKEGGFKGHHRGEGDQGPGEYAWTPGSGNEWKKRLDQMRKDRERRGLKTGPLPTISRDALTGGKCEYVASQTDDRPRSARLRAASLPETCNNPVVREDGLDQRFCEKHRGGLSPSIQGGRRTGSRGSKSSTTPKPDARSPPVLTAMTGIKKRAEPIPIVVRRRAARPQPIPVKLGTLEARATVAAEALLSPAAGGEAGDSNYGLGPVLDDDDNVPLVELLERHSKKVDKVVRPMTGIESIRRIASLREASAATGETPVAVNPPHESWNLPEGSETQTPTQLIEEMKTKPPQNRRLIISPLLGKEKKEAQSQSAFRPPRPVCEGCKRAGPWECPIHVDAASEPPHIPCPGRKSLPAAEWPCLYHAASPPENPPPALPAYATAAAVAALGGGGGGHKADTQREFIKRARELLRRATPFFGQPEIPGDIVDAVLLLNTLAIEQYKVWWYEQLRTVQNLGLLVTKCADQKTTGENKRKRVFIF